MRDMHPALSHVGIHVWNLPAMVDFYCGTFGMVVTDRGHARSTGCELAFLSGSPDHHHQFVLGQSRPEDARFSTVLQLSFLVPTLGALRDTRDRALGLGASNLLCLNHGTALSAYVDDPEGNRIEIYWETPFYIPQPHGDPLDLDRPDADLLAETEAMCRADPGFLPRHRWQENFAARL